jgi:Metallo-peptidase family M12
LAAKREQDMTKTSAAVFERLAKLLTRRRHPGDFQYHRELGNSLTLISPLGGGAIVALQPLHPPAGNQHRRLEAQSPCRRSPLAIGLLAAALILPLSLGQDLRSPNFGGSGTTQISMTVGNDGHKPSNGKQRRALRPMTAGMQPPAQAADRELQLAAFSPTALRLSPPRDRRPRLEDIAIDVIVAYTKAAASSYADIVREVIEPAIESGNESFQLSGIGHIKLRLVHAYQTDYVEAGDQLLHLWRFADEGDGHMDEVRELRDRYRADVGILIVDDANGCGQATRVGAEEDDAFAVVHHACASANYSLVHEIGHLIGASHQGGYVHGNEWRDIMSYKANCGGCPRLPVWSNPEVLIRGVPAGSPGHNNARAIAENVVRVAAFR